MKRFPFRLPVVFMSVAVAGPGSALAGSHLWRFNEIFSSADGTVQFIEMHECCGSEFEVNLQAKWVESDTTGKRFVFPSSIDPPTNDKFILLGTAGFAALPGAPTPDFIIPDSFFSLDGDTLRYWQYEPATVSYGPGAVPLDGLKSLSLVGGPTEVNSPTNYAGETGSVDISIPVPTMSAGGLGVLVLLMILAGGMIVTRRHRSAA